MLVTSIAIATVIALFFSTQITKPIISLKNNLSEFQTSMKPVPSPAVIVDEISDLRQSFSFMSEKIITHTRELSEERNKLIQRNEILENEIALARQIQMQFIPFKSPLPNIAFYYKPMEKVGGDFFDFFQFRNSDLIGIFVSDVSGHGVPAAFITSMIKSNLLQYGPFIDSPAYILRMLNQILIKISGGHFITAFCCIFNPSTRELTYSSAGHNPPFVIKNDCAETLDMTGAGFPLAVMSNEEIKKSDKPFIDKKIALEGKNKLLLYTDGFTEAVNNREKALDPSTADFESAILPGKILELNHFPSKKFVDGMVESLFEFRGCNEFDDDVCLICMDVE